MIPRPMTPKEQGDAYEVIHLLLQKTKAFARSHGHRTASPHPRHLHDALVLMGAMQQAEQFLQTLEQENRCAFKTWLKAYGRQMLGRIRGTKNSKASKHHSEK